MTVKIMVDTAMLRCLIDAHRASGNATSDEEQAMKDPDAIKRLALDFLRRRGVEPPAVPETAEPTPRSIGLFDAGPSEGAA